MNRRDTAEIAYAVDKDGVWHYDCWASKVATEGWPPRAHVLLISEGHRPEGSICTGCKKFMERAKLYIESKR